MSPPRIHVVGAGLAGLAAALRVGDAGAQVIVHEAAGQAGGRCRSYVDSALGIKIDNGNHLVLSGNHATLAYLARIGAADRLVGPAEAEFPFVDLAQKQRWLLKPNPGRVPWWIFAKTRRVPDTRAADYLKIARLMWAGANATVEAALDPKNLLYRRLWRPLLLAALNTDPAEGSARLAGKIVRETLLAGGRNCRPLIAAGGLSEAFVEPALAALQKRGANIRFGARLRAIALPRGCSSSARCARSLRLEQPTAITSRCRPGSLPRWCPGFPCRPSSAPSSMRISVFRRRRIFPRSPAYWARTPNGSFGFPTGWR